MATISLHGLNDFPKAFSSFIGRENEIREVSGFIVAPPARRLAELEHTLLEACPYLRILTTSREPLGQQDEKTWLVPPLRVPQTKYLLSADKPTEHTQV